MRHAHTSRRPTKAQTKAYLDRGYTFGAPQSNGMLVTAIPHPSPPPTSYLLLLTAHRSPRIAHRTPLTSDSSYLLTFTSYLLYASTS